MIKLLFGIFIGSAITVIVMSLLAMAKDTEPPKEKPAKLWTKGNLCKWKGKLCKIERLDTTANNQTVVHLRREGLNYGLCVPVEELEEVEECRSVEIAKNCIHYCLCNYEEICHYDIDNIKNAKGCSFFQDRSRFVELPCLIKPRDKVWYILEGLSEVDLKEYAIKSGECAVGNEPDTVIEVGTLGFWVNQLSKRNENCPFPDYCDFISWDEIGKSYFLSKEEAEQALKERET